MPPAERGAALDAACGDDAQLRGLVERLLEIDSQSIMVSMKAERAQSGMSRSGRPEPGKPRRLEPGQEIDRYVVHHLLGAGGAAQVWAVKHQVLGTWRALKVLIWAEPGLQNRLLREARAQAALVHENIVQVDDVLEIGGSPAILMPLITGPTLRDLLREHTPSRDEAIALLRATATGVGVAHDQGFAHRDLKPGNILLDIRRDGGVVPRVADFGLVKNELETTYTRAGTMLGTLVYAAPEQIQDAASAGRPADMWALGVLLYEMLAGRRPYRAGKLEDMLEAFEAGPDLDGIDPDLAEIIAELLRLEPSERLPSCTDLLARLPEVPPLDASSALAQAATSLRRDPAGPQPTWQGEDVYGEATQSLATADLVPFERPHVPPTPALQPPLPPARPRRSPLMPAAIGLGLALVIGGVWLQQSPQQPPESAPPASAAEPTEPTDPPPREAARPAGPPRSEASQPNRPRAERPIPAAATPSPQTASRPRTKLAAKTQTAAPQVAAPQTAAPQTAAPQTAAPQVEEQLTGADPAEAELAATPPVTPPAPARVIVTGNPKSVRLLAADGTAHPVGEIPPGRYTLEARFERGGWDRLPLELTSGQEVTVHCGGGFDVCDRRGG